MANEDNLKPFKKGYDPRRGYKPKGTKHLSTHIQEMLHDENFSLKLSDGTIFKGAPMGAVLTVLVEKAMNGDLKAIDLLAKYGYGSKIQIEGSFGNVQKGMSIEEINAILERDAAERKNEEI